MRVRNGYAIWKHLKLRKSNEHELPETFAGGDSAGPARALIGARLGDGRDNEALHPRARVVGILLVEPRVYHVDDVVNGEAGLRNVGGQHHLQYHYVF